MKALVTQEFIPGKIHQNIQIFKIRLLGFNYLNGASKLDGTMHIQVTDFDEFLFWIKKCDLSLCPSIEMGSEFKEKERKLLEEYISSNGWDTAVLYC